MLDTCSQHALCQHLSNSADEFLGQGALAPLPPRGSLKSRRPALKLVFVVEDEALDTKFPKTGTILFRLCYKVQKAETQSTSDLTLICRLVVFEIQTKRIAKLQRQFVVTWS